MKKYIKYYGPRTLIVFAAVAIIYALGRRALLFAAIIGALFLLFVVKASAQEKTTAAEKPKPEKPKIEKPTFESTLKANDIISFKLIGDFTIQQAQDYSFYESVGDQWFADPQNRVGASDYLRMKSNHQTVLDSLKRKFSHNVLLDIQARLAKFNADTTARYHPKKASN